MDRSCRSRSELQEITSSFQIAPVMQGNHPKARARMNFKVSLAANRINKLWEV